MVETVLVRVYPDDLEKIRRFGDIHGWSFAQFCHRLAIALECGIDGLTEWDMKDLQKQYRFSDVIIVQDVRRIIGDPDE